MWFWISSGRPNEPTEWEPKYTETLYNLLVKDCFPLWDFDYNIFDESYRQTLEQMVTDYFLFREVCTLPPERWKHLFVTRFKLLWDYYNQMFKTTLLDFNPLLNEYFTESHVRDDKIGQHTDFASKLLAAEKQRQVQANRLNIYDTGKLETLEVGHQDDVNVTITGTKKQTLQSEQGTEDSTEHVTQNTEAQTDVKQNRTLDMARTEDTDTDTDSTENVSGTTDKTVDGTSDSTLHTTENIVSSETKTHSDYPQANISATPNENPGNWATWTETIAGTSDRTLDTTEGITTKETTNQRDTKDTTANSSTTEEKDISQNETEAITTNTAFNEDVTKDTTFHKDTTDELQKNETEDVQKDYDGDIDTEKTTETDTIDTRDQKEHNTEDVRTNRDSALATSEDRYRNINVNYNTTRAGIKGVSQSELLNQYRRTILNVNREFVTALEREGLFMGVW